MIVPPDGEKNTQIVEEPRPHVSDYSGPSRTELLEAIDKKLDLLIGMMDVAMEGENGADAKTV